MTDPQIARRTELMRLPKAELVRMVRTRWVAGANPPERWSKEELAGDIAYYEEHHDQYAAYGMVTLVNGRPVDGSRPHCGGVGCTGHDGPGLPWPDVRDRYRAKGPCISAGPLDLAYRIDVIPAGGAEPIPKRASSGYTRDTSVQLPRADFAASLAVHFRMRRPEYATRPIRVMVWETRDGEHYRDDPPPPSPVSTSHSFPAGAPDPHGHTCPECSREGVTS